MTTNQTMSGVDFFLQGVGENEFFIVSLLFVSVYLLALRWYPWKRLLGLQGIGRLDTDSPRCLSFVRGFACMARLKFYNSTREDENGAMHQGNNVVTSHTGGWGMKLGGTIGPDGMSMFDSGVSPEIAHPCPLFNVRIVADNRSCDHRDWRGVVLTAGGCVLLRRMENGIYHVEKVLIDSHFISKVLFNIFNLCELSGVYLGLIFAATPGHLKAGLLVVEVIVVILVWICIFIYIVATMPSSFFGLCIKCLVSGYLFTARSTTMYIGASGNSEGGFKVAEGENKREQARYAAINKGILAIPREGESPLSACQRVQKRHPRATVFMDPVSNGGVADLTGITESAAKWAPYGLRSHRIYPPGALDCDVNPERSNAVHIARGCPMPSHWVLPDDVLKTRWNNGCLNLGFSMHGTYKGIVQETQEIGRIWDSNFEGEYSFPPSAPWDGAEMGISPAFAGLLGKSVDRSALMAISHLTRYYDAAERDFRPTAAVRSAWDALAHRELHCFRFLIRLASMMWCSYIAESANGELAFTSAVISPTAKYIENIGSLASLALRAANNEIQPIFYEIDEYWTNDISILTALHMATGSSMPAVMTSGGADNGLINFWPEIPNCALYYAGPKRIELGSVSSLNWREYLEAMYAVGNQWGVMDQVVEAIETAAFFALRPSGDGCFLDRKKLSVPLPPCDTSALALGPMITNIHTFDNSRREEPDIKPLEKLHEGAMRYALSEACMHGAMMSNGGGLAMCSNDLPEKYVKTMRFWMQSAQIASGMGAAIESIAETVGWTGILGRSLLPFGLPARHLRKKTIQNMARWGNGVQWEELIPVVDNVPTCAAYYSALKPSSCSDRVALGKWYSCKEVVGRVGTADAFYSLLRIDARPDFRYYISSGEVGEYQCSDINVIENYGGRPRDNQFFRMEIDDQVWTPAFKIKEPIALLGAIHGNKMVDEMEWYIFWDDQLAKDTALARWIEDDRKPTPVKVAPRQMSKPSTEAQVPRTAVVAKKKVKGEKIAPEAFTIFDEAVMIMNEKLGSLVMASREAIQCRKRGESELRQRETAAAAGRQLNDMDVHDILLELDMDERHAGANYLKMACQEIAELDDRPTVRQGILAQQERLGNYMAALQVCPAMTKAELEEVTGKKSVSGILDWDYAARNAFLAGNDLMDLLERTPPPSVEMEQEIQELEEEVLHTAAGIKDPDFQVKAESPVGQEDVGVGTSETTTGHADVRPHSPRESEMGNGEGSASPGTSAPGEVEFRAPAE